MTAPPAPGERDRRGLPLARVVLAAPLAAWLAVPAGAQEPAAVVEMTDALTYEPARVSVAVGETVRWTNPSGVKHTVTADPALVIEPRHVRLPRGAARFDSGPVAPGESWSHTFDVPGRYDYFCIPHELDGMVGTVVVAEAGDAGEGVDDAAPPEGGERRDAGDGSGFVLGAHQAPRHPEVRRAEGFMKALYWLGNLHPAATHMPIGLLFGAAVAELLLMATGRPLFLAACRFCVWSGALGAVAAGVLGWLLAGFRIADGAWLLTAHRWLGTAAVALSPLLVALVERASAGRGAFRLVLFTAAALVLAAGFLGGAMIYGLDHYAWPA